MASIIKVGERDLKEWETDFKKEIQGFLKVVRLDYLAYEVTETDVGLDQVWKRGKDRIETVGGVTTTTLGINPVNVKPTPVVVAGPVRPWIENPKLPVDWLFRDLAREIAKQETEVFVNSLLSVGKEFKSAEAKASSLALSEAYASMSQSTHNPDTLVVHPVHHIELFQSKDFVSVWSLRPEARASKGGHFYGFLGATEVYWTADIDKQKLLFYEKELARIKRSSLKVRFDDYGDPKHLIAEETFVAWAMEDSAIGIIKL